MQQLCEAGEEEFLEIMALVGMASKPLHVRRLQKSLQEWAANPVAFMATAVFQGPPPVFPGPPPQVRGPSHPPGHIFPSPPPQVQGSAHHSPAASNALVPVGVAPSPALMIAGGDHTPQMGHHSHEFGNNSGTSGGGSSSSGLDHKSRDWKPTSPVSLTPVLLDSQIQRLSEVAERLVKSLPPLDPKKSQQRGNKDFSVSLYYNPILAFDFAPLQPLVVTILRRMTADR